MCFAQRPNRLGGCYTNLYFLKSGWCSHRRDFLSSAHEKLETANPLYRCQQNAAFLFVDALPLDVRALSSDANALPQVVDVLSPDAPARLLAEQLLLQSAAVLFLVEGSWLLLLSA